MTTPLRAWFMRIFAVTHPGRRGERARSVRLGVERLETRAMPSATLAPTIPTTVVSFLPTTDPSPVVPFLPTAVVTLEGTLQAVPIYAEKVLIPHGNPSSTVYYLNGFVLFFANNALAAQAAKLNGKTVLADPAIDFGPLSSNTSSVLGFTSKGQSVLKKDVIEVTTLAFFNPPEGP